MSLSSQAVSYPAFHLKMHHSFWATRWIYGQMLCCITMTTRANSNLRSTCQQGTVNTVDLSLDAYKLHVGLESHAPLLPHLYCCLYLAMRWILSWINLLVPHFCLSCNTHIVWSGFTFLSRTRTAAVMSCQSLLQNLPQRSSASAKNLPKT